MAKRKNNTAERGFLYQNLSLSWDYIKESRDYILLAIGIFVASALLGYFKPVFFVDFIRKFVEDIGSQTQGLNTFQLIIFILENNIKSSFIGLATGIILGIFPLFTLFLNGYVLGFVGYYAAKSAGTADVLLKLLPHGIFELPALIISLALGIRLGMFVFARKNFKEELLYKLDRSLRVFIFIIIPLLIIAGIIEGTLIGLGR